jgi:Fe-S cluster biogenesis protein NfuA
MKQAEVASALSSVRGLVQADGGDMELVGVDESDRTVSLRLVLDGVDCHECVMPRPLLEDIAGDMLRRAVPDVARVTIDDPRERPGYLSPDAH